MNCDKVVCIFQSETQEILLLPMSIIIINFFLYVNRQIPDGRRKACPAPAPGRLRPQRRPAPRAGPAHAPLIAACPVTDALSPLFLE